MGLTISSNYAYQPSSAAGASAAYRTASAAGTSCSVQTVGNDSVSISKAAESCLSSIVLPTKENALKATADLSEKLGSFLSNAGVSAQPPFELSVGNDGEIAIKGSRADKQKILDLINGDHDMKMQVSNTVGLSSQTVGTERALKAELEYMASSNPSSVVAKYSSLYSSSGQGPHVSLTFDGKSVQILSGGKPWVG